MHPIHLVRHLGFVEAVSFLLLLGVAMPLKYVAGMPMPVKVVGWIHGVLFMLLIVAVLRAMIVARLPVGRAIVVAVAALIPFGPFAIDGKLKRWADEFDARGAVA
jgi:integral membrane protein